MYLEDKKTLLCAIDHGFSTIKTEHFIFEKGVKKLGSEATLQTNTMLYKGSWYKVGEGRLPIKDTKVEDEDYFLLTLAAIAKEMDYCNLTNTDVIIAAGLPFTRFGQEKDEFKEYLNPHHMNFQYNGKDYEINCKGVMLYPQCYAAVADRLGKLPAELLIVDIGSKTVDIIHTRKEENTTNNVADRMLNAEGITAENQKVAPVQQYSRNQTGVIEAVNKNTGKQNIVVEIAESTPEKTMVKLSDGSIVDYKTVEINNPTMRNLYNFAATFNDTKAANAVIENYNGESMPTYLESAAVFYNAGKLGKTSYESIMNNPVNARIVSEMSPSTLLEMYYLGENSRSPLLQNSNVQQAVKMGNGSVIDNRLDKSDNRMKLVVEMVAKKTGLDIELNDELEHGENGNFQKALSRIALAKTTGKGTTTNEYTPLVHELGEFSEAYNHEGMQKVVDTVLDYVTTKEGAAYLTNTIEQYHKAYKTVEKGKTYEDSANEYVFDYVAGLFADQKGVEVFSEYMLENMTESQHKSVLKTIADFFKGVYDKITSYLNDHVLSSTAKKALRADAEEAQRIRDMFMGELEKAQENYKKINYIKRKAEEFKNDKYKKFERIKVTDVNNKMELDAKKQLNVDIKGYTINANTNTFEHIEKRHGENGEHDRSMKNMDDVALMAYVLDNYDRVEVLKNAKGELAITHAFTAKDGTGAPMMRFEKDINGKQYVVVAVVENKYKKLWVVSEYKKEDTSQTSNDDNILPPTSETHLDTVSSEDIISHEQENTRTFSLDVDSEGRKLSEEQKKYFENSTVRDDNGNLLPMYHGTPNGDFTVFKNDIQFFTPNRWYADFYQEPSASSRKAGKTVTNKKTYEVYLNITKPFDIRNPETKEIFINDYVKGGYALGINPYEEYKDTTNSGLPSWEEADNIYEFLEDNKVYGKIRNEKYRYIADQATLFPEEVDQYNPNLVKEIINNCIAHSDYRLRGKINVEEYEDHLVFINEGAFIPETVEQALEPGYKPPYYRNAFLCNAMVNMYMIDTNSMGIPMIYEIQKDKCFPLPTFDLDTPNRVIVTVYGKVLDSNYTRLLHANGNLDLRTVFLLDQVQKRKTISKDDFSQLKSRNLVEGRYPNIYVSYKIAKEVGDKANYVRQKGLDEEVCMQFILSTLKLGPAKKADLLAVLKDVLPYGLSEQQKSRKLSNLLQKMKKNGIIDVRGIAINSEWYLLTKQ